MDAASPLSKAFFLWVQPTLRNGFKRPLSLDDSLELPKRLRPSECSDRFATLWAEECKSRRAPSVMHVLWRILWKDILLAATLQVGNVVCRLSCVLLLRVLVKSATTSPMTSEAQNEGLVAACCLALLNAIDGLFSTHAQWRLMLTLYSMLGIVGQAVFDKGMNLHPGVQDKFRRGDMVNLALSDSGRLVEMSSVLMVGASAPVMLFFSLIFLVTLLGPTVLVTLIAVCINLIAVRKLGAFQGSSFRRKAMAQGRRMGIINEMLQSIRFTKFYALEDHYYAQVSASRKEELRALIGMKSGQSAAWPLAATVPVSMAAIIFSMEFAFNGGLPSAPDTLAIVAFLRFMYIPFAFFGGFLGAINMLLSVTGRLGTLLLQPTVEPRPLVETVEGASAGGGETEGPKAIAPPAAIKVDAASSASLAIAIRNQDFRWGLEPKAGGSESSTAPPTLKSVTAEVPRGELWAVVGTLGSGKSSLLAAAAGGINRSGSAGGGVRITGRSRVLVTQEPMVLNATLRDNVLFGEKLAEGDEAGEARYSRALEVAALEQDLDVLPAGDMTEIGERGLTLSGGQKARVALARAVYAVQPGGIVLLDDPLAAVDAHVGAQLFERCIVEALDGTTRMLVTNQLQYLDHQGVNRILVMEDGRIAEQGTYSELSGKKDGIFSRMLTSVGSGKKSKEDEEDGAGAGAPKATVSKRSVQDVGRTNSQPNADGKLTKAETKQDGAVTRASVGFYITALGGLPVFIFMAFVSWLFNLSEVTPDLFLAAWQDDVLDLEQETYLFSWIAIAVGGIAVNVFSRFTWVLLTTRAAAVVHEKVLSQIIHCTTAYFDKTPSGRMMARLGEDQMLIDWTLSLQLEVLVILSWTVFDQIALILMARPLVAPVILVIGMVFMVVREVHRRTNRECVRLWLVTKSPLFQGFEETLSGSTTIKAFGREQFFRERFETALRANMAWLVARDATNIWMEQRLTTFASLAVFALALQMVYLESGVSASVAAIGLIYSLNLGTQLKFLVYFLVQVEGVFASVERIVDFIASLDLEPPAKVPEKDDALMIKGWPPADAALTFEGISMRYRQHLPLALDNLSVKFQCREKVGIVGRTGSGKSSVISALVRLYPLESGRILFGGVDMATCGMKFVRETFTVVPQDPILFSGELKRNLDPLQVKSDQEIWSVLSRCGLDELVKGLDGGLQFKVSEGGKNFSVGERQVFCLARALLRGASVLCLDEATANVDPENDRRVQHVLSSEVKDCLVLTIAHRLNTVIGSDRIMVLDQGHLAQLDSPTALLEQEGIFRDLAAQAGITAKNMGAITKSAGVFRDLATQVGITATNLCAGAKVA